MGYGSSRGSLFSRGMRASRTMLARTASERRTEVTREGKPDGPTLGRVMLALPCSIVTAMATLGLLNLLVVISMRGSPGALDWIAFDVMRWTGSVFLALILACIVSSAARAGGRPLTEAVPIMAVAIVAIAAGGPPLWRQHNGVGPDLGSLHFGTEIWPVLSFWLVAAACIAIAAGVAARVYAIIVMAAPGQAGEAEESRGPETGMEVEQERMRELPVLVAADNPALARFAALEGSAARD